MTPAGHRLWLVLLILAAGLMLGRGPARAIGGEQADFTAPYAMSRTWMLGGDPYDLAGIRQTLSDASGGRWAWTTSPAYPPSALLVIAPLAVLPWWAASSLWTVVLTAAWIGAMVAVLQWLTLWPSQRTRLAFLCAALAFAPAHTGVMLGNPGILSGSLAVIALVCATPIDRRRAVIGGVIMALAIALKPPLALPLWAYWIATRRWTAALTALGLAAALSGAAAWDIAAINPHWFDDMRAHMATMPGLQMGGDAIRRFGRLSLATLVSFAVSDRTVVQLVVVGLLAVPGLSWLIHVWPRAPQLRTGRDPLREAVVLTPLLAMSLLVVYHRPYDAVILLPTLGWVVAALDRPTRVRLPAARLTAGALGAFLLLPWATTLIVMIERGVIPMTVARDGLFQFFVLAVPTWAVVGILTGGLWAMTAWNRAVSGDGTPSG